MDCDEIKVGITGDIIPADSPLLSGQGPFSACKGDFSHIFSSFQKYAEDFDYLIGNFEAVLVDKIDKVSPATSAMKAPLSILPILKRCKFKYLSIANNHTMEYGPESFYWMCDKLQESGLEPFGHRENPYLLVNDKERDITLGLFAFSTVPAMYGFRPQYYFVDTESDDDITALLDNIETAKRQCDHLLVFPHWGSEFMTDPAPWQIELAGEMTQRGADAIFGAHPHIIQTACLIDKKPVFFSLGNLLSDYFQERLKKNIVVNASFGKDALQAGNQIFTCGKDFVIHSTTDKVELKTSLKSKDTAEEYRTRANTTRTKVRNELVRFLLKHPHRWVFNFGLFSWLISRAVFLAKNRKEIQENPNAVYTGPIH